MCNRLSHLDHIGALPYFTEVCGYSGPIYMTVSLSHVWWNVWEVFWCWIPPVLNVACVLYNLSVHYMSIYSFPSCAPIFLTAHLALLMTKWLRWGVRGTLTSQVAYQMFHMWTFEIHDCHRNWIIMLKLNCTAVSNQGISSCDVGGLSKSNGWAKRWRGTIYLGAYCGMHEKRYMRFFLFSFSPIFSFGVWHKYVCSSHFGLV